MHYSYFINLLTATGDNRQHREGFRWWQLLPTCQTAASDDCQHERVSGPVNTILCQSKKKPQKNNLGGWMGSHQETCLYVNFYCFPTSQYFWTMSILFLMPQNWNFKLWSNAYIFSVSLLNTSGSFQYCFRCSVSKNFSGGKTTQKCELKSLACVTIFICKMIKTVEISARFKTQTAISAGLMEAMAVTKNQSIKEISVSTYGRHCNFEIQLSSPKVLWKCKN